MTLSHRHHGHTVTDFSIVAILVAAVYLPVVFSRYGYTDDFWMFFYNDDMPVPYFSAGRVLTGLTWLVIHERIHSVSQLALLRLLALIAACVLGCLMYLVARSLSTHRLVRLGVGVSVAALPSVTVLVAWATCWTYAFSPVFGLLSSLVAASALRVWPRDRVRAVSGLVASTVLLLVAMGIYQPGVSWFWIVPLSLVLDDRFMTNSRHRVRLLQHVAAGLVQLACCFIVFKFYFVATGIEAQQRSGLLSDPLTKLAALLRIQIPLALNQWQVLDASRKPLMIAIATIVATVLLLGVWLYIRRHQRRISNPGRRLASIWLWIGCLLVLFALSHTHWWAIEYTAKNYRTAGAFVACVTVLLWWSVQQIIHTAASSNWRNRALSVASLLLAMVALAKCGQNVWNYWVLPYSTAYTFAVQEFADNVSTSTERIHLIRQSPEEGIVTRRNIYNFGRPFTDFDWAIDGFVEAVLHDANLEVDIPKVTHGLGGEPVPAGPAVAVIDMRQLTRFRPGKE